MKRQSLILFSLLSTMLYPPLPVVKSVDIKRYAGKWYEIASFPQYFQRGCTCTTAEYTAKDDYVIVHNECRKDSPTGKVKAITGKAFPVPGSGNAKLDVQFFWPFKADYWIIALDEANYSYAMVGHPNRKYLWILSRTPKMDTAPYEQLVQKAKELGFDVTKLKSTDQSCH